MAFPRGRYWGHCYLLSISMTWLVDQCENGANIYLFAYDAKIYKHVSKLEDKTVLQQCVDSFMEWTERWMVKVNVNKCKVM